MADNLTTPTPPPLPVQPARTGQFKLSAKVITYTLVGLIAAAVLITIVMVLRNVGLTTAQPVTLQFWGVFDDHTAFDKAIADFRTQYPNIDVKYTMLTYEQYEKQLVDSLAAGTGPDVVMIHNTWLPKHGNLLAAMPNNIPTSATDKTPVTIQDFQSQFVDVAAKDLTYNNQVYGMSLYVDTLALYYNKDLFNTAGITAPPKTWDDVNADVPLLAKFDKSGNLTQEAIALGTSQNINRSTDILQNMMLQSGVQMTSSDNAAATFDQPVNGQHLGEIALQYYTNFANPQNQDYSWNPSQHYSIDAFTEGTLAMMIGYSHDEPTIVSKSPRLNFGIAPMPQASATDIRDFANYWALGVTAKSAHQTEAWEFVNYMASKEGATTYLNATNRPAARRDLIDLQRTDPVLGVFAVQALSARSWFQADNTAIETVFGNMIDDVNFNRASVADAIGKAASQVTVLMQQH